MNKQQKQLMRCGDSYAYGLWLQENTWFKNQPPEVGAQAYLDWWSIVPPCGHKQCAKKRPERLAMWQKKAGG